jgi:hypothetical protein
METKNPIVMKNEKDIDRTWVRETAQSIIDEIVSWKYHEDNDNAHYLYEAAMTSLFWKEIWDWLRENT